MHEGFSWLPEHYQEYLGPYLDQSWGPGWEQNPAEDKRAWLEQLLAAQQPPGAAISGEEFAPGFGENATAPVDRFGWVTGHALLMSRMQEVFSWGPEHYQEYLGPYLDRSWGPGWEQNAAEDKRAWLEQLLNVQELPGAALPDQEFLAEFVDEVVAPAVAEALEEVDGVGLLSEEEIYEAVNEALAQLERGAS